MKWKSYQLGLIWTMLTAVVFSQPAMSQATEETSTTGIVVSSKASTLVVRTEAGAHQIFTFDRLTAKPKDVPIGSEVRVISLPTAEAAVRLATDVIVTKPPSQEAAAAPAEPVPIATRRLDAQIARQARKWGAGVRAGVGMDQEILLIGLHARFGPFFNRNFSFRPNLEFGWGEVTKMFAFNPEATFRLPLGQRLGRWSAYVGGGPALQLVHRNFEEPELDFGELDFEAGLNVLGGVELRSGVFFEAKTTLYASPHLRLIFGYTF